MWAVFGEAVDLLVVEPTDLGHKAIINGKHWGLIHKNEAFKFLLTLPGVGPYAAGNIMQLLGRYSRLAIDTETIRHAKKVLGYDGSDAQITKMIKAHYEPFGEHQFRSYWFEIWQFYETKAGPAHTWEREKVSTTFTAANL